MYTQECTKFNDSIILLLCFNNNIGTKCISKTAGEQARITLKCLESLTYLCTDDVTKLVDLDTELKRSLQTFRDGLPQEEQLVVRPSVISRALNTKRK